MRDCGVDCLAARASRLHQGRARARFRSGFSRDGPTRSRCPRSLQSPGPGGPPAPAAWCSASTEPCCCWPCSLFWALLANRLRAGRAAGPRLGRPGPGASARLAGHAAVPAPTWCWRRCPRAGPLIKPLLALLIVVVGLRQLLHAGLRRLPRPDDAAQRAAHRRGRGPRAAVMGCRWPAPVAVCRAAAAAAVARAAGAAALGPLAGCWRLGSIAAGAGCAGGHAAGGVPAAVVADAQPQGTALPGHAGQLLWSLASVVVADRHARAAMPRKPSGEDARPGPRLAARSGRCCWCWWWAKPRAPPTGASTAMRARPRHELASCRCQLQSAVTSCGTNTETSLPCMFAPVGRRDYDEGRIRGSQSLLHVLARAGVGVHWRDNQSGCKGVCEGLPTQDGGWARGRRACAATAAAWTKACCTAWTTPGASARQTRQPAAGAAHAGQPRAVLLPPLPAGLRALQAGLPQRRPAQLQPRARSSTPTTTPCSTPTMCWPV
jgi:hypothetical protein